MAEENDINTPQEQPKPKVAKPRVRKPKPLVEGINTPVANSPAQSGNFMAMDSFTPMTEPSLKQAAPLAKPVGVTATSNDVIKVKTTLTDSEKRLIAEDETPKSSPRLLSKKAVERANKKPAGFGTFLLWFLFFLALGFSLYEAYGWYMDRHSSSAPIVSTTPTPSPAPVDNSIVPTTTPTSTATTTPPSSEVAPTPAPVVLKQLKISPTPTGYLNVRSTPSSSGSLVTKVNPGDVFPYTDSKNGWYQITLTNGQTGWVIGTYAKPQ